MVFKRFFEFVVGLFMLFGIVAIFVLAFKVSGFSQYAERNAYHVTASFDHIGDLKVRAPITIAGVRIGEVAKINIDTTTFKAKVTMLIDNKQNTLPSDSSARILTAGIIGANYIEITPGFAEDFLHENSVIEETHPAIVLENLIGQLVYSLGNKDKNTSEQKV